jgi:hypothetical protein
MELRGWTYLDQITLDDLEVHLWHCQATLLLERALLVRNSAAQPLQDSFRRHLALSLHTLALLEEQRVLLAQVKARLERRLP